MRKFKGAILGISIGFVIQIAIAVITNIYIMIPFYEFVMGFPEGALLGMMQKANPAIKDVRWGYGLFAGLPFNAIKNAIVIAATLIIYKPLRKIIERVKQASL